MVCTPLYRRIPRRREAVRPYAPSTERPPCFFSVIPRARSARGNPFPFHVNQRPKAATYLCRSAAKARFDNRLKPQGGVSKGEGSHRPKAIGKEDSVKETRQGFLSRSIRKPIFALQKS